MWFWLLIVSLIVCASLVFGVVSSNTIASAISTPIPTATLSVTVQNTFPSNLICSDVVVTGETGAIWHGITLGESTVDELLASFKVDNPKVVERESGAQSYRFIDGINLYTVDVCTQDSTIIALSVSMIYAERGFIDEFVRNYGIPDTIAYTFNTASRVAFWFEYGIAIEVQVIIGDPFFGRVGQIVLFPPQPVIGYEERWPYNRTWPVWIPPHEERDDLSDVLNPFDFEAMLETSTPTATPPSASD